MAIKGEISIKGETQGQLEGPRENGRSLLYEFKHKVYVPLEEEGNTLQGSRKIMPFEVVKFIDKTTPQLYAMICNNEQCEEILVVLYRIEEASGQETEYFNFSFKQARIISVENWMPPVYNPKLEEIGHLEKIKFLAKDITWTYLDGGVTFNDTTF